MQTISELWYGNIHPFEQCTCGDKRVEELEKSLTEKQKEILEKLEECLNEMHDYAEQDAFSYGFRLGLRLMAEALTMPIGEE